MERLGLRSIDIGVDGLRKGLAIIACLKSNFYYRLSTGYVLIFGSFVNIHTGVLGWGGWHGEGL